MSGMEDFYTRDVANEGIKIPLYLPTGEESEHWIRIRGIDSDSFRDAETKAKRNAINIASIADENEKDQAIKLSQIKMIASLIIEWSFEQECIEENIVSFLQKAPQIYDAIDRVAGKRKIFFAQRSSNSTNT